MKAILVTLKKGKHHSQPWTFTIDKPGPASKETKRERYTRKSTAKRGALRVLGAVPSGEDWVALVGKSYCPIRFTMPIKLKR